MDKQYPPMPASRYEYLRALVWGPDSVSKELVLPILEDCDNAVIVELKEIG